MKTIYAIHQTKEQRIINLKAHVYSKSRKSIPMIVCTHACHSKAILAILRRFFLDRPCAMQDLAKHHDGHRLPFGIGVSLLLFLLRNQSDVRLDSNKLFTRSSSPFDFVASFLVVEVPLQAESVANVRHVVTISSLHNPISRSIFRQA